MLRPCSQIRCPMNAATCKCHGVEGCEYYTPQFTSLEVAVALRFLADMMEESGDAMLSDWLKENPIVIKE